LNDPDVAYRWHHLADLPAELESRGSTELAALRTVWLEQREALQDTGLMEEFNQQLLREYAIEGGIIERAYTLDRGITQILIERGIDAALIPRSATNKDPEYVAQMIRAHQDAVECVFDLVKRTRPLSTSAIKELHAVLLQHEKTTSAVNTRNEVVEVDLIRGDYKKWPNNPQRPDGLIHEYCPSEHVASEMDAMLALHHRHMRDKVPAEVEAAWLHHVFTQIHPFQDGNGRIARLLATYVLLGNDYFPLTLVDTRDRVAYLDALEDADRGNLIPLIDLFVRVQRRTFVRVLGIAGNLRQQSGIDQVISSARTAIEKRREVQRPELEQARRTAAQLHGNTVQLLSDVAAKLSSEIGSISDFEFIVDSEAYDGPRSHYFRTQVIEVAEQLNYFANPGIFHAWARLVFRSADQAELLVSFHGIGHEYRGLIVATAAYFSRSETEEASRQVSAAKAVADEFFQINYAEAPVDAAARYRDWLDSVLKTGLEMWRASL
jgi:Fic family protein